MGEERLIELPLPRGTTEGERSNDSTAESWAAWGQTDAPRHLWWRGRRDRGAAGTARATRARAARGVDHAEPPLRLRAVGGSGAVRPGTDTSVRSCRGRR